MPSKDELELLIAGERPVGEFLFDEENQCFTTDTEVIYEIIEAAENVFCSGEYIYFGGYAYSMEDHEKKTWFGPLEAVAEQVAQDYIDENHFMDFPVIYTSFRVELVV
ncbi:MAG: hypothetical protein GXY32_10370 [Ruminococcaceae bacterium]|nr:hypothetical protein [Oscillospiraceae bacterium]